MVTIVTFDGYAPKSQLLISFPDEDTIRKNSEFTAKGNIQNILKAPTAAMKVRVIVHMRRRIRHLA
jgi:hypothetical protein